MKFIKGTYAFTDEELDRLILARQNNERIEINGRKYIPLFVEKRSKDIAKEDLEQVVMNTFSKKEICNKLGTSFYKFTKFLNLTYGSDDLDEVRKIINKK